MANRYGTDKLPETYLVVRGEVVEKFVGATNWDDPAGAASRLASHLRPLPRPAAASRRREPARSSEVDGEAAVAHREDLCLFEVRVMTRELEQDAQPPVDLELPGDADRQAEGGVSGCRSPSSSVPSSR